jgi:tripartite-type tricarboxylate transporter receptor subunit TctC
MPIPFLARACAGLLLAAAGTLACAQAFPARPLTLVVPFAPGASADGLGRLVARELGQALGQPVVVENRPGGGGATGLIQVAKAAPDGYTLGMGATGALVLAPHLPDAPPLQADRQLQPLARVAEIPLVLVAGPRSGYADLQAVLAQGRGPGVTIGNSGQYTAHHLSAELLAGMAKAKVTSVPYRGSAPAVNDVLGGQVPLAVVDLTSVAGHLKAGTVKALAVTSPARSKLAPDVPTVAEAGVPGYAASAWMGLFLPRGVPPAAAERLSRELQAILTRPEVQQQVLALAAEPAYQDGAQFGAFIDGESRKWARVIAGLPKQN